MIRLYLAAVFSSLMAMAGSASAVSAQDAFFQQQLAASNAAAGQPGVQPYCVSYGTCGRSGPDLSVPIGRLLAERLRPAQIAGSRAEDDPAVRRGHRYHRQNRSQLERSSRDTAGPDANGRSAGGISENPIGCPAGYTNSLTEGCLPDLSALVPPAERKARPAFLGVPLGCPIGYVNSLSSGCLPDLAVLRQLQ